MIEYNQRLNGGLNLIFQAAHPIEPRTLLRCAPRSSWDRSTLVLLHLHSLVPLSVLCSKVRCLWAQARFLPAWLAPRWVP